MNQGGGHFMQRGGPVGLSIITVLCALVGTFTTQPGNVASSRALVTSFPTQPGNVANRNKTNNIYRKSEMYN